MEPLTLAELAYQAYGSVTDFKNFRGEPMPAYKDLPETIQKAWEAATAKVKQEIREQNIIPLTKSQIDAIQEETRKPTNGRWALKDVESLGLFTPEQVKGAEEAMYLNCGVTIARILLDGYIPEVQANQEALGSISELVKV